MGVIPVDPGSPWRGTGLTIPGYTILATSCLLAPTLTIRPGGTHKGELSIVAYHPEYIYVG